MGRRHESTDVEEVAVVVRSEPRRIDTDRWPSLAAPSTEEGAASAEVARSLRSSARELGLRIDYPDHSAAGEFDAPVRLVLTEPERFWARLSADGATGLAESYMAGEWATSDPVAVLGALLPWVAEHPDCGRRPPRGRSVPRPGGRRRTDRVELEDDLPGDLVSLHTDETMSVTAGAFASGARSRSTLPDGTESIVLEAPTTPPHVTDLGSAQRRAADMLLDLAGAGRGTHVLVVPAGWGEIPLRAAERGGGVRTVTTSTERLAVLGARFAAAGMQSSIALSLDPLDTVTGSVEAVVSAHPAGASDRRGIRMVVDTARRLLRPGGRLVLQSEMATGRGATALDDLGTWRRTYVADDTPSSSTTRAAVVGTATDRTGLEYKGQVDLTAHHAETARLWRELFAVRSRDAAALGFDAVYRRMWTFHLAAVEASCRQGWIETVQTVFTKGEGR